MKSRNKLKLLDIENYIQKNKLKEVKNSNIFGIGKLTFDEEGLWSETIFGRSGSNERKETFGYIDLNGTFINPVIYKMIKSSSDSIRDILNEKQRFIIKDKNLIESDEGQTGLLFLCSNYDKINFETISKKDKKDIGKYIETNKHLIFIKKYQILPAGGIRDMSMNTKLNKQFTSEINTIYENLISLNNQLGVYKNNEDMSYLLYFQIQKLLIASYSWIQNRMEGKGGILRGTMLKKTMDYSSRIIATSDPNIELGKIGVPWHTLLAIYEPFFFNYILVKNKNLIPMIKEYMNYSKNQNLGYHDLKNFIYSIIKNSKTVKDPFRSELKKAAEEITKDKQILCKRDPATTRSSYYSATPVVVENQGAVVNALTCGPQGLDFDGDQLSLCPIFTNEATKNAEKLNPAKNKKMWTHPINNERIIYNLADDAISTLYHLTKV